MKLRFLFTSRRKGRSLTADINEMLHAWRDDEERLQVLTDEDQIDRLAYRILMDQMMYRFLLRIAKKEGNGGS